MDDLARGIVHGLAADAGPVPLERGRAWCAVPRGSSSSGTWAPRSGIAMRLQAIPLIPSGSSAQKASVQLVLEVLGRSLGFTERSGRFEERIELAMLTVDDRARAGHGRSTTIDMRLTADERNRAKAIGVRWLSRVELKPGRHQIRVAARSANRCNGAHRGTMSTWRSSLVIVRR